MTEDQEGQDMGRHRRSAAGRAATGRAAGATETYSTRPQGYQGQYSGDAADSGGNYAGSTADEFDDGPYIGGYGVDPQAGRSLTDTYGSLPVVQPDGYGNLPPRPAMTLTQEPMTLVQEPVAPAYGMPVVPRQRGPLGRELSRPALGRHPEAVAAQPKASRRKPKTVTPVRTGLLGVSAAVALGTVAVASGLLPGAENYSLGSDDKVQSVDTLPSGLQTDGGAGGIVTDRESTATGRGTERSSAPATVPAQEQEKEKEKTEEPSATPSTQEPSAAQSITPTKPKPEKPAPPRSAEKAPAASVPAQKTSEATAAAAEVLKLVNKERSKVGCSPLTASSSLAELATAFSDDMAAQGFFDHVDPGGADPWDRAAKAGITSLGGENIARGQGTAQAVMDAWMDSPGHRANILNCDFKTLGVGVHLGDGGPWWTQDFGY